MLPLNPHQSLRQSKNWIILCKSHLNPSLNTQNALSLTKKIRQDTKTYRHSREKSNEMKIKKFFTLIKQWCKLNDTRLDKEEVKSIRNAHISTMLTNQNQHIHDRSNGWRTAWKWLLKNIGKQISMNMQKLKTADHTYLIKIADYFDIDYLLGRRKYQKWKGKILMIYMNQPEDARNGVSEWHSVAKPSKYFSENTAPYLPYRVWKYSSKDFT